MSDISLWVYEGGGGGGGVEGGSNDAPTLSLNESKHHFPANNRYSLNVGSMLGQRRGQ